MKGLFLVAFILCSLFFRNVYADCMACTESYKVTIELKTGKKLTGYIEWNRDFFDFYDEKLPEYVKGFLAENNISLTARNENLDELFVKWCSLKNLEIEKEYEGFSDKFKMGDYLGRNFDFYKEILKFPSGAVGVAEGKCLKINFVDVLSFVPEKQDLHVDTTGGLTVFSADEMKLLRTGKPFYSVAFDTDVSDWVVSCYSPQYVFSDLMNDAAIMGTNFSSFVYKGHTFFLYRKDLKIDEELEKSDLDRNEALAVLHYLRSIKKVDSKDGFENEMEEWKKKLKANRCVLTIVGYD